MADKICVGMTTAGMIKSQTAFCLVKMLQQTKQDYEVVFKEGPNQPLNREVIAETALQLNCSHLLFVDSDMVFEKDALNRLLKRDKDIIGVHYNMRKLPLQTTVKGYKDEELYQCEGVATGFMLIKTKILKDLAKPWFHVGLNGSEIEGHDYRFCRLAREKGYEVWCDNTIHIKHLGDFPY